MTYTGTELSALARLYCEHEGISLAALGERIFNNHKFFKLLAAGKGAHSRKIEEASEWFEANWPEGSRWPEDVIRAANEAA